VFYYNIGKFQKHRIDTRQVTRYEPPSLRRFGKQVADYVNSAIFLQPNAYISCNILHASMSVKNDLFMIRGANVRVVKESVVALRLRNIICNADTNNESRILLNFRVYEKYHCTGPTETVLISQDDTEKLRMSVRLLINIMQNAVTRK